jgi:oxygen-independent coproporphyrinogen-3 oxidase
MKKLGIYVQVPFCQTKCTYCNFHTGVVAAARFAPYVEAVCREIRGHRELLTAAGVDWPAVAKGHRSQMQDGTNEVVPSLTKFASSVPFTVDTVYFGGGTPSLLEPGHLANILEAIRKTFGPDAERNGQRRDAEDAEIRGEMKEPAGMLALLKGISEERPASESGRYKTRMGRATFEAQAEEAHPHKEGPYKESFEEVTLEADPETITEEKAAAWVQAGINRVSFGLQSFVDKELVAAGRIHRRADIYRGVPILRAAGIRNISFDLIAGLPHQTRESWKQSLEELAALAPEHVSVYLLEVDEGSRLGKELLQGGARYSAGAVPSEDEMAEFYEMAQALLGAAGYHHYEISNWAKPGFESKHNLKYWRREPYLGFGAGAHSFSGTQRWANAHDAAEYVRVIESGRLPVEQLEAVTAEMALEEELFLGLRQLDGIDVARIEREYGVALGERFSPLASAGLVEREGDMVRLAAGRLSVSNEVFVELMK